MGDLMRPLPFDQLLRRVVEEHRQEGSVFGIPEASFFRKSDSRTVRLFGESCDLPLGPAAGPHTQLAQNIVTAYLTGGRFFELKTVQKLDTLQVSKPCIDAEDECFNCEWSTEYTLEKAYDEYVKAWVLLHVLEELFGLRATEARSFLFNMSVGYDLDGIKTPRMNEFVDKMIDSSASPVFQGYLKAVDSLADDPAFLAGTALEPRKALLKGLSGRISPHLSPSATLSTLHGCPPAEIEAICRYMLTVKKTHTFVKLNPTLLGYATVRGILDRLGFGYVELAEAGFEHDLQYADAVPMLERLLALAKEQGLQFGVKLTNTLGTRNTKGWLPDAEMYMSGRALFPLSINLAAKLTRQFGGGLPISYSGGAAQWNVDKIVATGIRPVTVATDLLKPGGYLRLAELARGVEAASWERTSVDADSLGALAAGAVDAMLETRKSWRGRDPASIDRQLPLFDCYAAPCTLACPIGQDVPQYLKLAGEGKHAEALELIYAKNALPNITGHICDHQCQLHCTRLDYDDAVEIREVKRIAADNGWAGYRAKWARPEAKRDARVAVVGAGPAGLASAFFLARSGFPVTVFDKHDSAGGVVEHVIPRFRIPAEAVEKDIRFVQEHGVEFRFGAPARFDAAKLQADGFRYVVLAVGAEKGNHLKLQGEGGDVRESLDFLAAFHADPAAVKLGRRVVVVGGGNTAMDSARAALKCSGVEEVTVVYRRSEEEMPADREEVEACRQEGVSFRFLTNPEAFGADGCLVCRKMALGAPDASGRRSPVATEETETLAADTLVTAIGESVDGDALAAGGLVLDHRGNPAVDPRTLETSLENVYLCGDARTGPSTVVRCIAEARRVADAVCRKEGGAGVESGCAAAEPDRKARKAEIYAKKGSLDTPAAEGAGDPAVAAAEAKRCLECHAICNKCVDVCPNRANVAVAVDGAGELAQAYQVLHLDALCNECGNCARFCPYTDRGRPYKDKLTVFSLDEDFVNSENSGFYVAGGGAGPEVKLRLDGRLFHLRLDGDCVVAGPGYREEWGGKAEAAARIIETVRSRYGYLLGPVGL